MNNQLHDFMVKGTDGVIYKAIYALENNFFIVCDMSHEYTDLPIPVYIIRGEKLEEAQE